MQDLVESFFEELGHRGRDPLLGRLTGTGRFEIFDGDRTDHWLVTLQGGYVAVSRGDGEAEWMMRADRRSFEQIISGKLSAMAALMRGTLDVRVFNTSQRFARVTRLFAGPPESRG